jgi:hypothetical protein
MAKKPKYVPWYFPTEAMGKTIFKKDNPSALSTIIFADDLFVGIMLMDKYGSQSVTITYANLFENYLCLNLDIFPYKPTLCGREIMEEPINSR